MSWAKHDERAYPAPERERVGEETDERIERECYEQHQQGDDDDRKE